MIGELLTEYRKRQSRDERILGALCLHYEIVPDPANQEARQSACVGNLYDYLARVLDESNDTQFQQYVRYYLENELECIYKYSFGRYWVLGLKEKEPGQDAEVAKQLIEQHYKHRELYRKRQKGHAEKTT